MPVAAESLHAVLDRLADFESESAEVVSVYLDLKTEQAAQHFGAFLDQAEQEHERISEDIARMRAHLESEKPDAQAVAMFSCTGEPGLFEVIALDTPIGGHRLYIDTEPHVFPLERLADQHRTYAALLVNTNSARLFVFSAGAAERQLTVKNKKGKRVSAGGWSQARYQRRAENLQTKHMREVADAVEKLVREEEIAQVLVAADEVALPLLKEQLSPSTAEMIVELEGVDVKTSETELLRASLEAFREADQRDDQERVDALVNAYRSRGLATVGLAGVRAALERGQVDRLLVPATPAESAAERASAEVEMSGPKEHRSELDESAIEELVTMARRTDADITFIEDARLLEPARGVGAMLRYRL